MSDLLDRLKKRIYPGQSFFTMAGGGGAAACAPVPQTVEVGSYTIGGPDKDIQEAAAEIERLSAALERIAQAETSVLGFFTKHALGPKLPPSCLVCGHIPLEVVVRHAELPGIVVCKRCKQASDSALTGSAS